MIYVKIAFCLALFAAGFYVGALRSANKLALYQAQVAGLTSTAVLAQRSSTQAQLDRLEAVIASYETQIPDPIALSVALRLLKSIPAGCGPVSTIPTITGTIRPTEIPTDPARLESAVDAHFAACAADAAEVNALRAAWQAVSTDHQ